MRKLKYILFFVILIFGLNSCLTTMVGWGICEQYGCTPSPKKMELREWKSLQEKIFQNLKIILSH